MPKRIRLKDLLKEYTFFDPEGNPRIKRINGYAKSYAKRLQKDLEDIEEMNNAIEELLRQEDVSEEDQDLARDLDVELNNVESLISSLIDEWEDITELFE